MYQLCIFVIVLLMCILRTAVAETKETKEEQEQITAPAKTTSQKQGKNEIGVKKIKTLKKKSNDSITRVVQKSSGFEQLGQFIPTVEDLAPSSGLVTAPLFAAENPFQNTQKNSTDFTGTPPPSPFAYKYAMDKKSSVNAGVTWINDLGDTKGLSKAQKEPNEEGSSDKKSGVNLHLGASYKAFTFTGGYIRALDNRTSAELALEGKESDPIAWNSEIAYSTELLRRATTLAVGYQKSSDALQYYLPEERYKTKASMVLSDSTTFSLEFYQDKNFSALNGEDGGYGITTKIGFGF
jgi:hypothetical protein